MGSGLGVGMDDDEDMMVVLTAFLCFEEAFFFSESTMTDDEKFTIYIALGKTKTKVFRFRHG